jgi:hypothetical protein
MLMLGGHMNLSRVPDRTADGFAPEHPWGLIFSSHDNFDADYCWYPSLEEAYKESRLVEEFEERQQKG